MKRFSSRSAVRTERISTTAHISLRANQRGHSRMMMILCIAVPLIAIATLFAVGSSWMAWSTALFLLCPIVMGGMMVMMMRDQRTDTKAETTERLLSKDSFSSTETDSSTKNAFKA